MAIDFTSWSTYFQAAVLGIGTWIVKTLIAQGKEQVRQGTILEYYVERQTRDALERLDKGNPAPPHIVQLARKRISGGTLTDLETKELITWLRWTGSGLNPNADSAERSAALQLLTGFKTREFIQKRKKRWWQ